MTNLPPEPGARLLIALWQRFWCPVKWLKLDCDFRNDPKILSLSHQFGGKQACSFWVLLLSYIGAYGMPTCEIQVSETGQHSLQQLASWLHAKPKVVITMLSACANLRLIIDRKSTRLNSSHVSESRMP